MAAGVVNELLGVVKMAFSYTFSTWIRKKIQTLLVYRWQFVTNSLACDSSLWPMDFRTFIIIRKQFVQLLIFVGQTLGSIRLMSMWFYCDCWQAWCLLNNEFVIQFCLLTIIQGSPFLDLLSIFYGHYYGISSKMWSVRKYM